jgi:hypothetical protein
LHQVNSNKNTAIESNKLLVKRLQAKLKLKEKNREGLQGVSILR